MKKIIGIMMFVALFLFLFFGSFFLIFYITQKKGCLLWFSILLGFIPTVGTIFIVLFVELALHLVYASEDENQSKKGDEKNE